MFPTASDLADIIKFTMNTSCDLRSPVLANVRVIRRLAEGFGRELAPVVDGVETSTVANRLTSFWLSNGLARATFHGSKELIVMKHCYDCSKANVGIPTVPCTFKAVILETVLREAMGRSIKLTETECCRRGGKACIFAVVKRGRRT